MKIEVPANIAAECEFIGTSWGAYEQSLFVDNDQAKCEWTNGTYCGDLPGEDWWKQTEDEKEDETVAGEDAADERRVAVERLLDAAAKVAWDAAWEAA